MHNTRRGYQAKLETSSGCREHKLECSDKQHVFRVYQKICGIQEMKTSPPTALMRVPISALRQLKQIAIERKVLRPPLAFSRYIALKKIKIVRKGDLDIKC